jgi:hypothetical protein
VPPAGQHADDAEPRLDVPRLAAGFADLAVANADVAVVAGREEHLLDEDALLGLLVGHPVAGGAQLREPVGEVVADRFELAQAEEPRAGTAAN